MANQVSVPKVQTTDRNVNQLQQNLITAINQLQQQINTLQANPLAGAVIMNNVSLAVGNNTINQTLGSVPKGFIVVDNGGIATQVYQVSATATQIVLNSTVAATVSLILF